MNRDTRRARLVLAFLLLASFTLLTLDYRNNGSSPLRPLERAVANIIGPGERAVASAVRPVTGGVHFGNESQQLRKLQQENTQLRRELEGTQDDRRKAQELDRLLGYANYFTMKPARVIAWGGDVGNDGTVTVDIGTDEGVHPNMTVVTGLGLVGMVVRADQATATVALIDDPGITVGARLARTGDFAKVTGRPDGRLDLTVIKSNASIKVGDTVVTLGSVGLTPYVPDVPIGTVVSMQNAPGQLSAQAVVQPFVDLDRLDLVGIVFPPPRRPVRGALVPTAPPAPTPSSTPSPGASPAGPATPRAGASSPTPTRSP